MTSTSFAAPAPTTRRVRAYFAPVERATQAYVRFYPAQMNTFDLDAPPAPWIDLGWIENFGRTATSKSAPILTGIPAATLEQTRNTLEAHLSFDFLSWTKLTMALGTGSQHMNVLAGSDGVSAEPAVSVQNGSTASMVQLAAGDASRFGPGSMIAVDADYAGQTGFVGSPVSGAFLRQALTDPDYIRRITFNVGLVLGVSSGSLILAQPLPGGVPRADAKVQSITGFVDREGGSFHQEWSGLFVMEGSQGDRIFLHYPRLQSMSSAEESSVPLDSRHKGGISRILLKGQFRALPVDDPIDGERVLCYRSFKPAAYALI
ncbi:MAG: hypothetical protein JST28_23720 [Acidobacteria bacterium]|nr:hypothetical protein [Acidobacteriota bacterium]